MKRDFSSGRKFGGGGGGRGGGSRFGGGGSKFGGGAHSGSDRPLYPAVCHECGADCEVPFRPDGSRPVLCRNCFKKNDGLNFDDRPRFPSPKFEKRPSVAPRGNEGDLKKINEKLDKILVILDELVVIDGDDMEEEDEDV